MKKDNLLLRILDPFNPLFKRMDIDYRAMRSILEVKLLLDSRRTATALQGQTSKEQMEKNMDKNNFLGSLWLYALLGLILVPLVVSGDEYLFPMSIVFGIFIFFMMTSLISDFSSVLLDLRDKDILLSRPISSKTLNAAKFIHIAYYMFMLSAATIGPALIASLLKRGFLFFLVFLIEIILVDLFLIVATGLLYLFILRFFDGEKLKDIINYVQIGLTITISIGYQLVGRMFNIVDLQTIEFQDKIWTYFLAPVWFAAPFEYIFKGSRENYIIIYSILAIVVPIAAIVIYIKTIPIFEANLQKLNSAGGIKKSRTGFIRWIGGLVCKTDEETNLFVFSTNMIRNERVFKLKVYPGLGFGLIFPFLFLIPMILDSSIAEIRDSQMHLSIYFIGFLIVGIVQYLGYSGNYKGAFVYKVMPIEDTASINKGALKACFINLFTPLFLFESIIFIFVFGLRILPDLIIIYINMSIITAVNFKILNKDLPFSRDFENFRKGKLWETFIAFIIMAIPALLHFLAIRFSFNLYIVMGIVLGVNFLTWKYIFKQKKLEQFATTN
nr:hypothetical protein [Tissierella sp.]